jgi:hypothetical protein
MGILTRDMTLVWRELNWPRPLEPADVLQWFRLLADDPTMPLIVFELRAEHGRVHYLLGCESRKLTHILNLLNIPGVPVDTANMRSSVAAARRLTVSAWDRPLDTTDPTGSTQVILSTLNQASKTNGQLIMQIVLGPRLHAATANRRSDVVFSWKEFRFITQPADATVASLWRAKTNMPGFRCTIRIGVSASTPARRQQLAFNLLGALKHLEAPGIQLNYQFTNPENMGQNTSLMIPRLWPLRLNTAEIAALCAIPTGDKEYPGLTSIHPKLLPTTLNNAKIDTNHALVALSTASATLNQPLLRSTEALLHHVHVLGPTGTGKSVTLLNLALQDMKAGRSVIVIEPKGDLVEDLLNRIPRSREHDVIVFDPLNQQGIIGLNPLDGSQSGRLKADSLYSIFTDLFADSLGVRTADILHASLLTIARQPDASLIQLPLLFSNPMLRHHLTAPVMSDLALGPFWSWYENLHDAERMSVIAPLMNKLRALILDPVIRNVIGQASPRFHLSQVLSEQRILLAPLPVNQLGEQGASLLGSLLIGQLWQATQARANIPTTQRTPVAVYVDEAQRFLHLGTDMSDILATSRSYKVGWTLAHQYLGQLPTDLRTAVLANCRSRISFQPSQDDAETLSKTSNNLLTPQDFTTLPAYHMYASLYDNNQVQPYVSGRTLPAPAATNNSKKLREQSAQRYGRPVSEIEAQFAHWQTPNDTQPVGETGARGMRIRDNHV